MKKSSKRFIKRIAMGVAVFLVPTILNILFYVVNIAKDPTINANGDFNYFNFIKGDTCINPDE